MAATNENAAAQENSNAQIEQMQSILSGVNAEMAALTEAYTEAYNAAQESISGQYELWDEAADVIETSASSINSALESQITYWQDYNANLQSLTARSADIEAMDMGTEAAESGRATVQGFIDAATGMLPQVQAAYSQVAQTAANAINTTLDIHSPSRVTGWSGNMAVEGFIQSAEKMEDDAAQAYSNLGDAGATALADEVQMVTMAPQLMSALMATQTAPAYAATPASGGGTGVSLQVEYHITSPDGEDLTRQLDQSAQNLRDLVRQTAEDMMDDESRGAYR